MVSSLHPCCVRRYEQQLLGNDLVQRGEEECINESMNSLIGSSKGPDLEPTAQTSFRCIGNRCLGLDDSHDRYVMARHSQR